MTFTTFGERFGGTEDFIRCKCNWCDAEFDVEEILVDDDTDKEYCPNCYMAGYIANLGSIVIPFDKEGPV